MRSELKRVPLSDLGEINPPLNRKLPSLKASVSFIPMSDVTDGGQLIGKQTRKVGQVRQGYTRFQEGDVLFAKITPCMENGKGAHAIDLVGGIGYGSTEFHVLRANTTSSARFLFHWTQAESLRLAAEAQMTGSAGQRRVPAQFFDRFMISALPLPEQRRIAEVLDTLDTVIERTEALVQKLKLARAGLLHDLLTRGLDEQGQLRDPEQNPEAFKDSELGRVPREWDVLPADKICIAILDCLNRTPPETEHGYPVVKTPNVREGRLITSTLTFTDTKSFKKWNRRGSPQRGDIVFTREAPAGEACVLSDMWTVCLGQRTMLYRPDPNLVLPKFMLLSIYSQPVQKVMDKWTGGSTVGHLRVGDVRQLPFLVPSLAEQKRISKVVEAQNIRVQHEQAQLDKLRLLKRGLMEDLLTGRVRVGVAETASD